MSDVSFDVFVERGVVPEYVSCSVSSGVVVGLGLVLKFGVEVAVP